MIFLRGWGKYVAIYYYITIVLQCIIYFRQKNLFRKIQSIDCSVNLQTAIYYCLERNFCSSLLLNFEYQYIFRRLIPRRDRYRAITCCKSPLKSTTLILSLSFFEQDDDANLLNCRKESSKANKLTEKGLM